MVLLQDGLTVYLDQTPYGISVSVAQHDPIRIKVAGASNIHRSHAIRIVCKWSQFSGNDHNYNFINLQMDTGPMHAIS